MAVTEKVVIKVEIDADIGKDLALIERRIKSLDGRTRDINKKFRDTDRDMAKVGRQNRDLDKSTGKVISRFDKLGSTLQKVSGVFLKFVSTLAKFSFIALAGQIGLFTAGLLLAKAALITGRASVSAYQASLRGLSVAAAGVATAIAVAAAAMRQFNEAQLGSQFGGGVKGRANAVLASRSIGSRTSGLLGREATSAMIGSLGRGGVKPSQASSIMRQLYNISGGDAKAAQALAASIGSGDLKKAKASVSGAVGFNEGSLKSVSSMQGLLGALAGGGATAANFGSLGSEMASTFIGTLKTEFAGLSGLFADLGAPLLEPFRQAFANVSRMLKEDVMSMTAVLQKFGAASFAPSIESFIGGTSEFIRKNIIANMGDVREIGQSFVDFGKAVRNFFLDLGNYYGKLEPAANVVIDMFKAMGGAAGGRKMFQTFSALVVENAEAFKDFGASIGNVFGALFDQLSGGQMGFFNKLPLLADVFNTLAHDVIPSLFGVFNKFAPLMERLPGALAALANILDMLAPIVGTLVSAISGLMGIFQRMSAGGAGPLGDIGQVALMGGLMMMTKGKGRGLLKTGAKAVGGKVAATGLAGRGAVATSRGFAPAAWPAPKGPAFIGPLIPKGFSPAAWPAPAGPAFPGPLTATVKRPGRLARMKSGFVASRNASTASLNAKFGLGRVGRGPGFLGKAGKLGLLSAGLEGLNMFNDYRDGGFSGIASGYGDRAEASPIFAGLGTGSAAAFFGGPTLGFAVGGATTALGAYKRGMAGDDSNKNVLTGAAGGAAAGAAIGSLIPILGTGMGAIVGGLIGGAVAFFAGKAGQKKLSKASEAAAAKIKLDVDAFKVGSGSALTGMLSGQADLLTKAMDAATDEETGNLKIEGDTRQFRDYLKSIGIDPESVNRDQLFEKLLNADTLDDMNSKLDDANKLVVDQMEAIADKTGLSMDEVERALYNFNIDPFLDYMEDSVAAMINLANTEVGDLSQVFLPNFFSSKQAENEIAVTQNAQLTGMMDSFGTTGEISIDQMEDFLSTSTQRHMMLGMDGTQASFAAIQALQGSLVKYLGVDAATSLMGTAGLNRGGSVMQELIAKVFDDLVLEGVPDMTSEKLANLIFGSDDPNATFIGNNLDLSLALQRLTGQQQYMKDIGGGDTDALKSLGKRPGLDQFTLNSAGDTALVNAITSSKSFESLSKTGQSSALRQLNGMAQDGFDVGEIGAIGEQYSIDANILSGIMTNMPLEFQNAVASIGDRLVAEIAASGRPSVYINGDLNTERGGATTYVVSTSISSVEGKMFY